MRKRLPGSVMQIHYETLALNPHRVAEEMYSFAQKAVPSNVTMWIKQSTRSSKNNGAYGTLRENSVATAEAWKSVLDNNTLSRITSECSTVIEYLT